MRCVQSLFVRPSGRRTRTSEELRIQLYVDDPLAIARGQPLRCRRLFSIFLLAMMVLGPPLAWHKASWGKQLTWCGLVYTFTEEAVTVTVPDDKIGDLQALTHNIGKHNVVSIGVLRTYIGKLQSIGSLLYALRPFLSSLWAALQAPADGAPPGHLWKERISHTLLWLAAFLEQQAGGPLVRTFTVKSYFGLLGALLIGTDASPWGLGGWIMMHGAVIGYFADRIMEGDPVRFNVAEGSADAQQF